MYLYFEKLSLRYFIKYTKMEKRIYKPPHFRDSEAFYSENYRFNEITIPVRVQKLGFEINENRLKISSVINFVRTPKKPMIITDSKSKGSISWKLSRQWTRLKRSFPSVTLGKVYSSLMSHQYHTEYYTGYCIQS